MNPCSLRGLGTGLSRDHKGRRRDRFFLFIRCFCFRFSAFWRVLELVVVVAPAEAVLNIALSISNAVKSLFSADARKLADRRLLTLEVGCCLCNGSETLLLPLKFVTLTGLRFKADMLGDDLLWCSM